MNWNPDEINIALCKLIPFHFIQIKPEICIYKNKRPKFFSLTVVTSTTVSYLNTTTYNNNLIKLKSASDEILWTET